jgi:hypothetical protein
MASNYRLTPGERSFLGKRVAEKCEAQQVALVRWQDLCDLRERAQAWHDKEAAQRQQNALVGQILELHAKLSQYEAAEAALVAARYTEKCRVCRKQLITEYDEAKQRQVDKNRLKAAGALLEWSLRVLVHPDRPGAPALADGINAFLASLDANNKREAG